MDVAVFTVNQTPTAILFFASTETFREESDSWVERNCTRFNVDGKVKSCTLAFNEKDFCGESTEEKEALVPNQLKSALLSGQLIFTKSPWIKQSQNCTENWKRFPLLIKTEN